MSRELEEELERVIARLNAALNRVEILTGACRAHPPGSQL